MKHKEIQASRWNPPAEILRISKERTRDILRLWCSGASWGPVDFGILAQSCYMQGINDCVDALQQRDLRIIPGNADGVCQVETGG